MRRTYGQTFSFALGASSPASQFRPGQFGLANSESTGSDPATLPQPLTLRLFYSAAMPTRVYAFLLLSLLPAFPALAQQKLTPQQAAATIHRMPTDREEYIHWQTECDAALCTLSTDVLRGASNDPPDRTDPDQYITLSISLPHKSAKPDTILLHLPPWADKDQGFFLAFVAKPPADLNAPPELDADGAVRLAIAACDDDSCQTQAPAGLIPSGNGNIDLFDKFLHSDHLILLFTSDGAPYRTSIPLNTFHKTWDQYRKDHLTQ